MPAQGSSRSRAGASSRDLARLSERTGEGGVGELLCFVCGAGGRFFCGKGGGGGDGTGTTPPLYFGLFSFLESRVLSDTEKVYPVLLHFFEKGDDLVP